ncbi:MAG: tyrosine-protein phosphatase [Proteobacteria bacterium]|nr:tyrosine-protein phosphatase [Pseudomonadota bacterium]
MVHARVLALTGVHNFRDYGGYDVPDGRRVRSGLLWRSAQHGDASDADLARIAALGLTHIIDLRGPSEREAKPCRRPAGFSAQVFHYPEETAGLALHTEAADGVVTAVEARAAMLRLYEGIAFRENLVPMIRCYFEALKRGASPSLVHCVAGKDRTGFAVALAQHVLGVAPDAIMDDYLLTNSAGNIDARIASGAEQIRARHGAIDERTIRILMGVDADYLETALAAVKTRYGSIDSYLDQVVGLGPQDGVKLRDLYLEG